MFTTLQDLLDTIATMKAANMDTYALEQQIPIITLLNEKMREALT